MERSLQDFRVRGVKTNIPFLTNLVMHPAFLEGGFTTRFLDETPELFQFPTRQDRATKLLTYIAEIIVNGHPEIKAAKNRPASVVGVRVAAPLPEVEVGKPPEGRATSSINWDRRSLPNGCASRNACW